MADRLKCAVCKTVILRTALWQTQCRCGTVAAFGTRTITDNFDAVIREEPVEC